MPTHELAGELVQRLREAGVTAAAILGRNADETLLTDPTGNSIQQHRPLCQRDDVLSSFRGRELTREGSNICAIPRRPGSRGAKCPHWMSCPYVDQFRTIHATQPQVIVRAHGYLALDPSYAEGSLIGKQRPDLIVIDESPLPALTRSARVGYHPGTMISEAQRLLDVPPWGNPITPLVEALRKGAEAVEAGEDPAPHDRLQAIKAAGIGSLLGALLEIASKQGVFTNPAASDGEILQRISEQHPLHLPLEALEALYQGIRAGRDRFNGIWLSCPVQCKKTGAVQRWIKYAVTAPLRRVRSSDAVILLDGTLDPILYRRLLPNAETVRIRVKRKATVVQIWDKSYSHRAIYGIKRDDQQQRVVRPEVLDGVQRWVNLLEAQGHSVGLVGPKDLVTEIDHPMSAHYQALRGVDRLKEGTAGIVIGRTLPSAYAVEKSARAIFPYDHLDLPGAYMPQGGTEGEGRALGYRMADGSLVGVEEVAHRDSLVHRVLRQKREAEVAQAVDRLRLIHREAPALVILLGRLPVDLTVDVLIKDPTAEKRLMPILEACGYVLPLSAVFLAERFPEFFKSKNAATLWMRRVIDPLKSVFETRTGDAYSFPRSVRADSFSGVKESLRQVSFSDKELENGAGSRLNGEGGAAKTGAELPGGRGDTGAGGENKESLRQVSQGSLDSQDYHDPSASAPPAPDSALLTMALPGMMLIPFRDADGAHKRKPEGALALTILPPSANPEARLAELWRHGCTLRLGDPLLPKHPALRHAHASASYRATAAGILLPPPITLQAVPADSHAH